MPDWRVVVDEHEHCRTDISSEKVGAAGMVTFFGGAPGSVDCLGGSLGFVSFGRSIRQSSIFICFKVSQL